MLSLTDASAPLWKLLPNKISNYKSQVSNKSENTNSGYSLFPFLKLYLFETWKLIFVIFLYAFIRFRERAFISSRSPGRTGWFAGHRRRSFSGAPSSRLSQWHFSLVCRRTDIMVVP